MCFAAAVSGDTGVDARPQTPRALEPNTHTQVPRAQAATAEAGAGNPENNCKKPYDPPVSGIKGHQLRMLQASPDRAYGARVQSNYRLEENRRKN